jgi:hypothetical protein
VVDGVDTSLRLTHGVIAWSTAGAVEAIQHARRGAGNDIAALSTGMSESLTDAARHYDRVDGAMGGRLGQEMRTR